MDDKRKADAISAVRCEIAKRIAPFCSALSPEELNALLDRMAQLQWKYDVMPINTEPADMERRLRELLE